jgi:Protein of unknown function (DUF5818)
MKRSFLLISILLLSAAWAVAQYGGGYNSQSSDSNRDSSQVTVLGCLAEAGGALTLTDQAGTTYQLTGKTEELSAHVGHTIRVTGASSLATHVPGSMSEGTEMQPTLSVASFKHVSSDCGEPGTGSY